MSTETKKEGEFDPGCVTDIQNKLHAHNYALRAFGALLRSSDLYNFSDEGLYTKLSPQIDVEAQNLRWGLFQIIELYLDHQEKILSEYCDQYYESEARIIQQASSTIAAFEHGAWVSREAATDNLSETITRLDPVINRGGELKEKAALLKETCVQYLKRLTDKKAPGGTGDRVKESPRI